MSISLLVKKLIAGIIALLMPISTTVATAPVKNQTPAPAFHAEVREDANVYEFEEDAAPEATPTPEVTPAPAADLPVVNETTTPAPAEEGTPIEEKTEAQAIAPVAEWDISDTDEDDVHMYYYAADADTVLDNITAAVRNIFLPITAYAETTTREYAEETAFYEEGTVIIEGEGATEEMLFLNWLDKEAFVRDYAIFCDDMDYEDAYILRTDVGYDGEFLGETVSAEYVDGLYAELPAAEKAAAILDAYIPVQVQDMVDKYSDYFWNECATFVPRHIIIRGDVTEINYAAFAFCTEIEDIVIESDLEMIDTAAFVDTGIKKINVPETVWYIGEDAFLGCDNLRYIFINSELAYCGNYAFACINDNAVIYCKTYAGYEAVLGIQKPAMFAVVAEDGEEENNEAPTEAEANYAYAEYVRVVYNA